MSEEYSGDWITARQKINKGVDWRDTANVSLGGTTAEIGHRLLHEPEYLEIKQALSLGELREYKDEHQTDAQERLLELQEKDELTDEEEAELDDLSAEVAQQTDEMEEALGTDAYDRLMWAGKRAIMPTQDDLEDFVFNAPTEVQREVLGEVPNHLSPDDPEVESALKSDMVETVSEQPFPITLNIGMQAFMETIRVLGNGFDREG